MMKSGCGRRRSVRSPLRYKPQGQAAQFTQAASGKSVQQQIGGAASAAVVMGFIHNIKTHLITSLTIPLKNLLPIAMLTYWTPQRSSY